MAAKDGKYSRRYKTMGSYGSMYKNYCYVEIKLGNIEKKEDKYNVTLQWLEISRKKWAILSFCKSQFIKENFGPYSIILPNYRGTCAAGF